MSAVKPTRLSFKHINEPPQLTTTQYDTTNAGSPFKKRLGDMFSTATHGGKTQPFGFEDLIS